MVQINGVGGGEEVHAGESEDVPKKYISFPKRFLEECLREWVSSCPSSFG